MFWDVPPRCGGEGLLFVGCDALFKFIGPQNLSSMCLGEGGYGYFILGVSCCPILEGLVGCHGVLDNLT